MKQTYPKHAEQLIKIYVPDAEELALKYGFGDLYALACERDEEAAEQLEMDCTDMPDLTFGFGMRRMREAFMEGVPA